jgi:hypothetical protein
MDEAMRDVKGTSKPLAEAPPTGDDGALLVGEELGDPMVGRLQAGRKDLRRFRADTVGRQGIPGEEALEFSARQTE